MTTQMPQAPRFAPYRTAVWAIVCVLSLSACGTSNGAQSQSTSGPSVWSADQKSFLATIFDASLVGSNFFSEEAYVDMGNVVCASFKKDQPVETVMSVVIATGRANGLAEKDRMALATTVTAAAVTYLCPTEIAKIAPK